MGNTIDIDEALGKRATITVDPAESPEEHASRVLADARQAQFELVKSYVLFFVVIAATILIAFLCVYEGFFEPASSADTKRWAQTTLSALFAGLVSFILGQRTAKKG